MTTNNYDCDDVYGDCESGFIGDGDAATISPASPTSLALDQWSLRRGDIISREWSVAGAGEIDKHVAADAAGALFEPSPVMADNPEDTQRSAWFRQLMDTPEYRALHNQTMLDADVSAIAAKALADQWVAYATDHAAPQPGDPQPGSDEESIGDTIARSRSVGQAVQAAQQAADDAQGLAAGLGLGSGAGVDSQRLRAAYKRLRQSKRLQDIMRWAGRFALTAASHQRQKLSASRGEITGVEMSGDLGRLLPAEMLAVAGAVPELETLALYRLATRRMMSYLHHKSVTVAAGPIVVGIDESGSMEGDKIAAAKGLALAMGQIARRQKRWLCLYSFTDSLYGELVVCQPEQHNDTQLLDWATQFGCGGTTLHASLRTIPSLWQSIPGLPVGKTDHIIITDAEVSAPHDDIAHYQQWASDNNVETYGIVLEQTGPGVIKDFCRKFWCLPSQDLNNDATATVLSI